jgi:hypothetical protein
MHFTVPLYFIYRTLCVILPCLAYDVNTAKKYIFIIIYKYNLAYTLHLLHTIRRIKPLHIIFYITVRIMKFSIQVATFYVTL